MAKQANYFISQESDLAIVECLDSQIFVEEELLTKNELQNSVWWVVRDHNKKPIAYTGAKLIYHDNSKDYPMCLFVRTGVLESARGNGLQKRLIRCRIAWSRKNKAKAALTYTMYNNNSSSNNLIKTGFLLYKPSFAWVGKDVLYWWKEL